MVRPLSAETQKREGPGGFVRVVHGKGEDTQIPGNTNPENPRGAKRGGA